MEIIRLAKKCFKVSEVGEKMLCNSFQEHSKLTYGIATHTMYNK